MECVAKPVAVAWLMSSMHISTAWLFIDLKLVVGLE